MYTLPNLPYSIGALEPHISRETLEYHYGIHHRTYVTKLNELIGGSKLESLSLPELVVAAHKGGFPQAGAIFNNAAQAWNHAFYWQCMRPHGSEPSLELVELLTEQFGDFDTFRREFTEKALSVFGSGWAWLVRTRDETLDVVTTVNAGTPITDGQTPLLTCDVWEHAYYIDYRNGRSKYLDEFWKVVDWEFVTASLHGSSQVSHAA